MPSPITTAAVLAGLCGLFVVTSGANAADPGPQDPGSKNASCCSQASNTKGVLVTNRAPQVEWVGGVTTSTPTFTKATPPGLWTTNGQNPVAVRVQSGPAGVGGVRRAAVDTWLELPEAVSSEDEVDELRDRLEDTFERELDGLEDLQEQLEDERERLEELFEDLIEELEDLEEEFEEALEEMEENDCDDEGDGENPFQVVVRGVSLEGGGNPLNLSNGNNNVRINRVRLIDDCKNCETCDEACCQACEGCGDDGCEVDAQQVRFSPGEGEGIWVLGSEGTPGAAGLWVGEIDTMVDFEDLAEGFEFEFGENLGEGFGENIGEQIALQLAEGGFVFDGKGEIEGLTNWSSKDGGTFQWVQSDADECEEECEEECDDDDDEGSFEEELAISFGGTPVALEWSQTPSGLVQGLSTTTTTTTEACGPHCELEAEVRQMREDLNALRDLLTPKVN